MRTVTRPVPTSPNPAASPAIVAPTHGRLHPGTPEPLALRPKEAANVLGIGQRKLWQLTKDGVIPCVHLGACVLYPVSMLQAWLAAHAAEQGAQRAGAGRKRIPSS